MLMASLTSNRVLSPPPNSPRRKITNQAGSACYRIAWDSGHRRDLTPRSQNRADEACIGLSSEIESPSSQRRGASRLIHAFKHLTALRYCCSMGRCLFSRQMRMPWALAHGDLNLEWRIEIIQVCRGPKTVHLGSVRLSVEWHKLKAGLER